MNASPLQLILTALLSQAPLSAQVSLLDRAPVTAHTVIHLEDATSALEQLQLNDVYRLLGTEAGAPLYRELQTMSPDGFDAVRELGLALAGEAVLFKGKKATALLVEPRGERAALVDAVRTFTETPRPEEGMLAQRFGDHRIETTVQLALEEAASAGDREVLDVNFKATEFVQTLIVGPDLVAALHGERSEVESWLRTFCNAPTAETPRPIAKKLRAARAMHGPAGQLETFVDLTFFKEEAERSLRSIGAGMDIDPSRLIGLDENAFVYGTFALPAGMNVDLRLHVHITPGTFLARLADTMRGLPSDLLGNLPEAVTGLHCLNWDFNQCYALVVEALREDQQDQGADQMEQALAAGSALTGSDLEDEFFGQIDGTFGLLFMPPEESLTMTDLEDDPLGIFTHMGLFAKVKDTEAILDVVEAMLGAVRMELLSVGDERGFDLMLLQETPPYDGGLAFGADHFLVTVTRRVMEACLETYGGVTTRTLLSGTKLQTIFDSHQGAAAVSAFRLGLLRDLIREEERDVKLPEGMEGLYETYMVSTVRRVRDGFDLKVQLH